MNMSIICILYGVYVPSFTLGISLRAALEHCLLPLCTHVRLLQPMLPLHYKPSPDMNTRYSATWSAAALLHCMKHDTDTNNITLVPAGCTWLLPKLQRSQNPPKISK